MSTGAPKTGSGGALGGISSWSIRNPIPTIVLFLALTLGGLAGYARLKQNNTPDMDLPAVSVTITYAGASPAELETQVAREVEDAVAGLGNVKHVDSTLTEGQATIRVEFNMGIDVDRATEDVRNAVSRVRANLPASVEDPVVQRVDATDSAILTYVVDAPAMAPDALSWFVDNDVARAVLAASGVSKIERSGGVEAEVRVHLDPDRLFSYGVSATEISQKLKTWSTDQPGGRVTLSGGEQSIRTLSSAARVEDLANARIALDDGRTLRLSDVARVEKSWAEPRQRARLDGKEVVGFSVYRSVGSSEVAVAHTARAALKALEAAHPDVTIREVTSSTDWVEEGFEAAIEALWIGALLSVAVVWLFLRDTRATLISAAALPLSLIPTFAVMHLLNQTLNNITLLAIALVVGILVDDAIVEIENIVRHKRLSGKGAYEAAMEAADEIGLAVVATTFSIVAVFGPVAFMGGIPGQFFRAFAIAVCASVLFSLVVARMLTPLMAAYLMTGGGHAEREPGWVRLYLRLLDRVLRHPWKTLCAAIVFFLVSISASLLIPSGFMPQADRGRSLLSVELAPGVSLAETDAAAQQASAILLARPEVAQVYAAIGSQSSGGGPGGSTTVEQVRKATLTANLKPRGERALSQQEFEAAVGPALRAIPGARVRFGADGPSGSTLKVALVSNDGAALDAAVERLAQEMRTIPGLANPTPSSGLIRPEIHIRPKPDKAAALGISPEEIAQTADIATVGDVDQNLAKFTIEDRQIAVRVMLEESARNDLSRIAALSVGSGSAKVPLGAVADLSLGGGPDEIVRLDRRRTGSVEAELVGLTTGEAFAAVQKLPIMQNLPAGVMPQASGDLERMNELTDGFTFAMTAGIVLVYFVLVLLFKDFLQPVTILMALPLSVGGALGLMLLTGQAFSMPAFIGLVMLMGIAAKNSILLVDYVIIARKEGMARQDALRDAARKRARPILMTTVAMVAGMLPLALGWGADAETRAPMAIAVIGGLISSTVLSLLLIPPAYMLMDDLSSLSGRLLRRLAPEAAKEASEADAGA